MATATRAIRSAPRQKPRPAKARSRTSAAPALPMPDVLLDARREPDVVDVPARTVLAIDGAGPPDGEPFQRSLGALYGVAYGLKFSSDARRQGFKVGPLEGRWWAEGTPEGLAGPPPREAWRWQLRIAVPSDVRAAEIGAVVTAAVSRKGGKLEGSVEAGRVRVERLPRARLGRILHVGPYADEPSTLARIDAALAAATLRPARSHVEIYLSDPRRTAPARLRTVLLREVEG